LLGHCILLSQDISGIANVLPKLAKELPVIVVRKIDSKHDNPDVYVRRKLVEKWLRFLKINSETYHNLEISDVNIALLPYNSPLEGLREITTLNEPNVTLNKGPADEVETKYENDDLLKEYERDYEDKIQDTKSSNYFDSESESIEEETKNQNVINEEATFSSVLESCIQPDVESNLVFEKVIYLFI
jgi:hypothetical protein